MQVQENCSLAFLQQAILLQRCLAPVFLSLQADSLKARGTAGGPSANTVHPQSPDTLKKIDMLTFHARFVASPT